jgi:IS30 family transposase
MKYKHLNQKEREIIAQIKFSGKSRAEMARALGRAKSTISREFTRNRYPTNERYIAYDAGPMY